MRRLRNVKIVATLGPASQSYDMIRALHEAGADVFRLNMSHGTHAEIAERHKIIRKVEDDLSSPIAILADLQGPKLRVGEFASGAEDLVEGDRFRVDLDPAAGDKNRVQLPHEEIFSALKPGAHLLVNDGKIKLKVEECGADFADCLVLNGGTISNRKGVNVPDVVLPLAALSEKDRADLDFVCDLGVDWLALSFVQRPEDLTEARELVRGRAALLSKIEKPSAVEQFDAILKVSDGIMVARGDLGVELPVQNVPPIQKRLVRKCRAAAKPVIVATQMLESMIESPTPTRAEVTDVSNAVYEETDAIMLSGETTVGKYPVRCVELMDRVARRIERSRGLGYGGEAILNTEKQKTIKAAVGLADSLSGALLLVFTVSGKTAHRAALLRPMSEIFAFTPEGGTCQTLTLSRGVKSFQISFSKPPRETISTAVELLRTHHGIAQGTPLVVVSDILHQDHAVDSILLVHA